MLEVPVLACMLVVVLEREGPEVLEEVVVVEVLARGVEARALEEREVVCTMVGVSAEDGTAVTVQQRLVAEVGTKVVVRGLV